ncbi:MAG: SBBP repeat-containing protein, partial [Bacteroidetes bacterium]|nr:SBBP repeat-containing protein [Bacteroidota bacterium]
MFFSINLTVYTSGATIYTFKDFNHYLNAYFSNLGDYIFGFSIPELAILSKGETLVIDPMPIRHWGTYYGGNSSEVISAVSSDSLGNIYIAGRTSSTNNIATIGAHQVNLASTFTIPTDAFVAKLNHTGNRIWGTYYG